MPSWKARGATAREKRNAETRWKLAGFEAAATSGNLAAASGAHTSSSRRPSDRYEDDRRLELAAAREEAASLRPEKAVSKRADGAIPQPSSERQLAELRESAAADESHLAAVTARLAELEAAQRRRRRRDAELANAHEE